MADNRSPEELAGGFIRITIGGSVRSVPTLKLREERDWRLGLAEALGAAQVDVDWAAIREGGDKAYAALAPMANLPSEISTKLVVAYDKSVKLGGAEWLEENADSAQIYQILLAMCRVVFPFVNDLRSAMGELMGMLRSAGRLPSDNSSSTNGRSPTGDSTLTDLKELSTVAS